MAIMIEHDKRKVEILQKAFEVFLEEGYANATFQKIANRCGITRTTLYLYFKNKREIFTWSIKQVTDDMEQKLVAVLNDESLSTRDCLDLIFALIIECVEKNKQLFNILLPYLIDLQKRGEQARLRVARRTVKLRHFLNTIIIRGQKTGELKKIPVSDVNDLIFNLIEGAVFRIIIYAENDAERLRKTLRLATEYFFA